MADQLYLSYWLRNFSEPTMLRHYEKLLRLFPFSRLAKQPSTFKVLAVDYSEPVVVEIPYPAARASGCYFGRGQGLSERRLLLSAGDLVGLVAIHRRMEA